MVAILSNLILFNFLHISDPSWKENLYPLTKYPLIYYSPPSLFPSPTLSVLTPLSASHDVLSCPVNLQIQEEDSSFSHHRQRALCYRGGSHNSGESPVLTRHNDRAEERPDSRTDLLVHSLQTSNDTHTDGQKDTHAYTHTLNGYCMKIIEWINPTWAEISFRLFGLFPKAQRGGQIMRSSLG